MWVGVCRVGHYDGWGWVQGVVDGRRMSRLGGGERFGGREACGCVGVCDLGGHAGVGARGGGGPCLPSCGLFCIHYNVKQLLSQISNDILEL